MKVDLGTFKDEGDELAAFLEPRVGTKPSLSGSSIEIEDGSLKAGVRPRHVKTYIKRFLYMKGVRKKYRVFVAGKELTIQEIEVGKEEEEKEKKAPAMKPEEKTPEEAAPEKPEAEETAPAEETKAEEPKAKPKKGAAKKPRAKKKKSDE